MKLFTNSGLYMIKNMKKVVPRMINDIVRMQYSTTCVGIRNISFFFYFFVGSSLPGDTLPQILLKYSAYVIALYSSRIIVTFRLLSSLSLFISCRLLYNTRQNNQPHFSSITIILLMWFIDKWSLTVITYEWNLILLSATNF